MNRYPLIARMMVAGAGALALAGVHCAAAGETPSGRKLPAAVYRGLSTAKIDFPRLDQIVGRAKVVVFGEDSHEMAAEHDAVRQIFEHLAQDKGFRVIVFESQWGIEDAFKDFMASDRTTLNETEQFFLDGAFASPQSTRLLIWIRDFNRAHPGDPIRLAGFQPEQPVTDFRDLWRFFAKAAPDDLGRLQTAATPCRAGASRFKDDSDFLGEGFARRKAGKPTYTPVERAACVAGLGAISDYLTAHRAALLARSSGGEVEEAGLHVYSLRSYVDGIRRVADEIQGQPGAPLSVQQGWQHDAYQTGDHARFVIFSGLMKTRYGGKKLFFWMHDWHAARHGSELGLITPTSPGIPVGTTTVGQRLAEKFGPELVAIGSIVPCRTTCHEPKDSLEPAFDALFRDQPALVDLRHPTAAEKAALPLHQVGSMFANFHGFGSGAVVLDRQYDAILYLPSSTTTHASASGVGR